MTRDAEVAVPSDAAVAAGARSLPPRRGRRLSLAPYGLILPVAAAVVLLLGYPIYKLVRISFERYGLFELIQHKGHWIGLDNYRSVLGDHVFWDTVVRTVIFTIVNVGLTIVLGTLIALLLPKISAWVRVLLMTGLVLVWAMPVGRRRPGLLLDDELRERRPQLPRRRAPPGRRRTTTGTRRPPRASGWSRC